MRRKINYKKARLLSSAFRKLDEASLGRSRYDCLNPEERAACRDLLSRLELKLIEVSSERKKLRTFCYEGVRYNFDVSTFGRVFIYSPFSRRPALSGGFFQV